MTKVYEVTIEVGDRPRNRKIIEDIFIISDIVPEAILLEKTIATLGKEDQVLARSWARIIAYRYKTIWRLKKKHKVQVN